MSFGGSKKPAEEPDLGNVQQNEAATNQQATAIPVVMGTNKVALRWITPALNQWTKKAPNSRPGKK